METSADMIIIGNIITMNEKRPTAQAALVKDGVFTFIGDTERAKKLAGEGTRVLDYGDNYFLTKYYVS